MLSAFDVAIFAHFVFHKFRYSLVLSKQTHSVSHRISTVQMSNDNR